ncbi:MAG: type I methionyl aminopeptidase [Proteobacteria bacterium]|nr:type I methionyl aminopeptidase [Pseudomonadota bacterium]MCP4916686.1 type I methionyl aminopeptidase [Pseudomonadota bacterium]
MAVIKYHSGAEIDGMRRAGRLAADCLVMISEHIRPGITTDELDRIVAEYTTSRHARSAPLGYNGFPKSCCTSVNDVVCHGIPGARVLKDGDIINVDVTPVLPRANGFHGDTSATFYVGEPSPQARHVVEVARQCLEIGIDAANRRNARIGDIGAAIQAYAEAQSCTVVRAYCGHGIGRVFHSEPSVPHHGVPGSGDKLKRGMCFTIEPMINLGDWRCHELDDGWTAVTTDGSLSAQFEHTLAVTKRGVEVLTARSAVLQNSEEKPWAQLGPLACFIP